MQAGPEQVGGKEDATERQGAHGSLGTRRVVLAYCAELKSGVGEGGLDLLGAELVVAEATQSDRVPKVLL